MNKHRSNLIEHIKKENVLGKEDHRGFLAIQSEYGFAQRGGSFPITFRAQARRLVSDVNLLGYVEIKQLIHSEIIYKN